MSEREPAAEAWFGPREGGAVVRVYAPPRHESFGTYEVVAETGDGRIGMVTRIWRAEVKPMELIQAVAAFVSKAADFLFWANIEDREFDEKGRHLIDYATGEAWGRRNQR